MRIVVDANVLFAILIKGSMTEMVMLDERMRPFAPQYLFEEFEEHRAGLLEITKRSEEEFEQMAEVLRRRIQVVPASEFENRINEAESLLGDKDDGAYLAVCIAKNMPLWSNDADFLAQKRVRVYTTNELKKIFGLE